MRRLAVALFILLLPGSAAAQLDISKLFPASDGALNTEPPAVYLADAWRYHPGDNGRWAAADFDDSDWLQLSSRLQTNSLPDTWDDMVWFRFHLQVPPEHVSDPMLLIVQILGACDVFVAGALVASVGQVSANPASEQFRHFEGRPLMAPIEFESTEIVIAVRTSWHFLQHGGFRFTYQPAVVH